MTAPSRRDALRRAGAMAGAAALAAAWRHGRPAPAPQDGPDLARMVPESFDGWQVDPASRGFVRPSETKGRVYGIYDQVLERTFVDGAGRRIMLSIAYGGDQSTRLQLHRPEVCYRAGGFEIDGATTQTVALGGRAVPVTRLVARKPGRPEPITYWTVLGGSAESGGFAYQWQRVRLALQGETAEGMLVRISSIDPDPARAHALQERFALAMAAALSPAAQQRLLGASI